MDKLDNIGENEIRIIGTNPEAQHEPPKRKTWYWVVAVLAALIIGIATFFTRGCKNEISDQVQQIQVENDSIAKISGYVEITDTIINNVSLHRYIPVNARPKLVVGLIKEIPQNYILGAMAADFGFDKGVYSVAGAFVIHGEMLSHSKSKYGFCALLKDTVVIGNDLSTAYFERAIEENGDFFRQHALVHEGKVANKVLLQNEALRRSLCMLNDGRLCIIDTDMSVSLDTFAAALRDYGVKEAIALMGSGAAVRWAVDSAGRRYIAGADEYDFPDNVVNYIVWESTDSATTK